MDPFVFFILGVPALSVLAGIAAWHNHKPPQREVEPQHADEQPERPRLGAVDLYRLAGGTFNVTSINAQPGSVTAGVVVVGDKGPEPIMPKCTCSPAVARSFGGGWVRNIHEPDCAISPHSEWVKSDEAAEQRRIIEAADKRAAMRATLPGHRRPPPDPYDEGRRAFHNGRSLVDDPYPVGTEQSGLWCRGWARLHR